MSKINRPPKTLQDLLGSKNFGKNPDDLLQAVRPIVDLYHMWAIETEDYVTDEATVAVQQVQMSSILVPEGEIWDVQQIGITVVSAPNNDEMSFSCGISDFPGWNGTNPDGLIWLFTNSIAQEVNVINTGANAFQGYGYTPPRPLLLQGGSRIRTWLTRFLQAGNHTVHTSVRFYRLTV